MKEERKKGRKEVCSFLLSSFVFCLLSFVLSLMSYVLCNSVQSKVECSQAILYLGGQLI